MISIGEVFGGPECAFFDRHVRRLMAHCENDKTDGARVNIVYGLPGSVWKPDFIGVQTGKFSRREETLVVHVAVEDEWIRSTDPLCVLRYIYETADEALGMATSFFEKRGIKYNLERARRFLDRWKAAEGFTSYLDKLRK